jgi:hypothetical protein
MSPVGAFAIAEEGPVGTFTPGVSAIIIRWGIRGAPLPGRLIRSPDDATARASNGPNRFQ